MTYGLKLSVSVAALAALCAPQVAMAGNLDELVAAAKKEGELTVITLPHDWCGYGPMIADFKKKYGIKVNELNPDAGSGDEVEAIKAAGYDNRAILDVLVLAATKLISNYTNHLAETPNDAFMKGAEWTAPGQLHHAA